MLLILLPVLILFDLRAKEVCVPGCCQGVVVERATSGGRFPIHYLLIEWDRVGEQTMVVSPADYKRAAIGDARSAEYQYYRVLGATGSAYVPYDPEYGVLHTERVY